MEFKTILFDWDGTLLDSVSASVAVYKEIFPKLGIHGVTDEVFRDEFCANYHEYYAMKGIKEEDYEKVDEMWNQYYKQKKFEIQIFPNVKTTLQKLREQGMIIGLVSNGSGPRIKAELKSNNLREFFDVVVTEEEIPEFKPSPKGVFYALEKLSAAAESTLYVGDMMEDIRAGKAANVKTAAVLTGIHTKKKLEMAKPDYVFSRVDEVISIL